MDELEILKKDVHRRYFLQWACRWILFVGFLVGHRLWLFRQMGFWEPSVCIMVIIAGVLLDVFFYRQMRSPYLKMIELRARYRPECPRCGYLLVGLTDPDANHPPPVFIPRCPECGRPFRYDPETKIRQDRVNLEVGVPASIWFWLFATGLFMSLMGSSAWRPLGYLLLIQSPLSWYLLIGRKFQRFCRRPDRTRRCPQCAETIADLAPGLCRACGRILRAEDVFQPSDPLNQRDRRVIGFTLRLIAKLAGIILLTVVLLMGPALLAIYLGPGPLRSLARKFTGPTAVPLAVLFALIALSVFAGLIACVRLAIGSYMKSTRLLAGQAVPACPRCDADLTGRPIGADCPECGRHYRLSDLTG